MKIINNAIPNFELYSCWTCPVECEFCKSELEIHIQDLSLIGDAFYSLYLKNYVRYKCPCCNSDNKMEDEQLYKYLQIINHR